MEDKNINLHLGNVLLAESFKFSKEKAVTCVESAILKYCESLGDPSTSQKDRDEANCNIQLNIERCSEDFQSEFKKSFVQDGEHIDAIAAGVENILNLGERKGHEEKPVSIEPCIVKNWRETEWDEIIMNRDLKVQTCTTSIALHKLKKK